MRDLLIFCHNSASRIGRPLANIISSFSATEIIVIHEGTPRSTKLGFVSCCSVRLRGFAPGVLRAGALELLAQMLIGFGYSLGRGSLAAQHLALHVRQLAPQNVALERRGVGHR